MLGESPCKAYTYYGTHIKVYAYTHIQCIHDVNYDISHDTVYHITRTSSGRSIIVGGLTFRHLRSRVNIIHIICV